MICRFTSSTRPRGDRAGDILVDGDQAAEQRDVRSAGPCRGGARRADGRAAALEKVLAQRAVGVSLAPRPKGGECGSFVIGPATSQLGAHSGDHAVPRAADRAMRPCRKDRDQPVVHGGAELHRQVGSWALWWCLHDLDAGVGEDCVE
ncbi:hypothetical protein GCM10027184_75510 [Saccharothrix stipae]